MQSTTDDTGWVAVLDPETLDIVQILDDNEGCEPYAGGDYAGHCGGCDSCLLMQATHNGMKVRGMSWQELWVQLWSPPGYGEP